MYEPAKSGKWRRKMYTTIYYTKGIFNHRFIMHIQMKKKWHFIQMYFCFSHYDIFYNTNNINWNKVQWKSIYPFDIKSLTVFVSDQIEFKILRSLTEEFWKLLKNPPKFLIWNAFIEGFCSFFLYLCGPFSLTVWRFIWHS